MAWLRSLGLPAECSSNVTSKCHLAVNVTRAIRQVTLNIESPLMSLAGAGGLASRLGGSTNWFGRFVSPTTIVARGSALVAGRRVRGEEVFQRI